ncbi:MAG TPA: MMPL family transporter, partial [Polyangiaceae bacterium]|nr:MMPL family transporter [Polyangiaceae bacterium]
WVAIDVALADGSADPERLRNAARIIEDTLRDSQQFSNVGAANWLEGIAALRASLIPRLPVLFSRDELERQVAPRLTESAIRARLNDNYAKLGELDGIGQARELAADPLGFGELVYARLKALVPKTDAHVEQNYLISADSKHLLVTAFPRHALGDPESSHRIQTAVNAAQQRLARAAEQKPELAVVLTTAGAYRAAIDNEAVVKQDTVRAVWLVTIAVSVLLLVCFSRPLFGVLTLLPATAGVAVALLLYSFFSRSMSALALGFGAALISITVDQGVVYIAYLDRVKNATGRKAAQQTFSAVSLATLTTVGGFLSLKFSGYQLLEQLGVFAALGSAFSFCFVHAVFPLIFRRIPETKRRPLLPVDTWLRRLAEGRVWTRVVAAGLMLVGLGSFARPTFAVDINRLNTISAATRAAEESVRKQWGDLTSSAYVLVEGRDALDFQHRADDFDQLLSDERARAVTLSTFSPSQLWPGKRLAQEHFDAWRLFWNELRRAELKRRIQSISTELGFSSVAHDEFFRLLDQPEFIVDPIPADAYSLIGIMRARDNSGWVWLSSIERGPNYQSTGFAQRIAAAGFLSFDSLQFGRHLNDFLGSAFRRMLLIVTPFVVAAVALSFQNFRLILLVLSPVVFAFVATLGTFGILGRPIDVPGLLISVVVLGMGTNFSVYLVNAHQRYPDPSHPVHDSVRIAALLDGGATVLGMAVMAGSSHLAIQSVGLAGLFGIGFSLLGSLVLMPPILRQLAPIGGRFSSNPDQSTRQRFLARFRYLEPRVRWMARRLLRDSARLDTLARALNEHAHVLVIGASYGILPTWLLAQAANRRVTVLDFDEERSHVARAVLGDRGCVIGNDWSCLAHLGSEVDAILILEPPPETSSNDFGSALLGDARQSRSPAALPDLLTRCRSTSGPRIILPSPLQGRATFEEMLSAKGFVQRELEPTVHWLIFDPRRCDTASHDGSPSVESAPRSSSV